MRPNFYKKYFKITVPKSDILELPHLFPGLGGELIRKAGLMGKPRRGKNSGAGRSAAD
jgi:hypothetical protein